MKARFGKKCIKVIIIILAFVVLSFLAFIIVRNQIFSPETFEKAILPLKKYLLSPITLALILVSQI